MGTRLARWAVKQPGLSRLRKGKDVFVAMSLVADDKHGKFWMHPAAFLKEFLPDIKSRSALRDHQQHLADLGFIGRIRKGNRHTQTVYQILAYGELPADAFREYEKAAAHRGDRRPPRAQGRLRTYEMLDGELAKPDILTP